MRRPLLCRPALLFLLVLLGCTPAAAPPSPAPRPVVRPSTAATTLPSRTPEPAALLTLVSTERMLSDITALAAIQPGSGWRSTATQGEEEAFDYVATRLQDLSYLNSIGLAWEKEDFRLLLSTEIWEASLQLTRDGQTVSVAAAGLTAPADRLAPALRFDSDGALNDAQPDPLSVEGPVVLLRTAQDLAALEPAALSRTVAFLDYAAIDPTQMNWTQAVDRVTSVLTAAPAGLVVITHDSDRPGESHGTFAGDASPLAYVEVGPRPLTLVARLEDLAAGGSSDWEALARLESARLTWDADVFSPAASHNLVAHLPGADSTHAIILSAHVDSANNPGAMDDGGGAAVLLEVARVLEAAQVHPPTDLYLVWFGAEEAGFVGSYAFAAAHSELLDTALLMMTVDCPSRPLSGISSDLLLRTWASGRPGDERRPAPNYLASAAARYALPAVLQASGREAADNLPFATFDVPSLQMIYPDPQAMSGMGGFYYAGHIHDPYDSAERVPAALLPRMASLALVAALETGREQPNLRGGLPVQHRAVLVGSHTEAVQVSPAHFADLAAALSRAGYDVDAVPFGQAVTPTALQDADLVVVLPVLDYPAPGWNVELYDEGWSAAEAAALEDYVTRGGRLVLTNSAAQRDFSRRAIAGNEDWNDMNALARRFGVTYGEVFLPGSRAQVVVAHPLLAGVSGLGMIPGNGVGFALERGTVLATADEVPAMALLEHGDSGGQVLVLADVWMLALGWDGSNALLWENLAQWAAR